MMEAPKYHVPTFRVGLFDFRNVPWVRRSAKGKKFLQAYIPSDRVKDFIDGECARGNTHFCIHKTRIVSKGQSVRETAHHYLLDKGWKGQCTKGGIPTVLRTVAIAGSTHSCRRSKGNHLPLLLWPERLQPECALSHTVGPGQAARQDLARGFHEAGLPVPLHGARQDRP